MGRLAIKAKTPKEVAQIMSEQTGCDVFEKDVRMAFGMKKRPIFVCWSKKRKCCERHNTFCNAMV